MSSRFRASKPARMLTAIANRYLSTFVHSRKKRTAGRLPEPSARPADQFSCAMRKLRRARTVTGGIYCGPKGEGRLGSRTTEKLGCGTTPQAVRCGTREYTSDCGKKGSEKARMSIGTAKVQRRAGIRREQK